MSTLLSTISGHFGRAIVLGALLPAAIFIALGVAAAALLFAPGQSLLTLPTTVDAIGVSFLAAALAGVLFSLNYPLIRLFEGYPWRKTPPGRWRTGHYRRRYEADRRRLAELPALIRAAGRQDGDGSEAARLHAEQSRLARRLRSGYPETADLMLPTRLGNVIRSFEQYPQEQYGISGIPLWPRLLAVVDEGYLALLGDAKATFDFMLNSVVLNGLLGWAFAPNGRRRWGRGRWRGLPSSPGSGPCCSSSLPCSPCFSTRPP